MTEPGADGLEARRDGPAYRVTLCRPERRNALTPDGALALARAIEGAGRTGDARLILLAGAGGQFCAGLDLQWLAAFERGPSAAEVRAGLERFQAAILAIVRSPLPVVALLQGSVAGFGVDLAAACDLRLAGASATFTSGFARLGLVPDGGSTYTLPRLVGDGPALRFLLGGETLDAATALRIGLVDEVTPDDRLEARAGTLAETMAVGAPGSLAAIKRLCREEQLPGLERALRLEAEAQAAAFAAPEFQWRLSAFVGRTRGKPA